MVVRILQLNGQLVSVSMLACTPGRSRCNMYIQRKSCKPFISQSQGTSCTRTSSEANCPQGAIIETYLTCGTLSARRSRQQAKRESNVPVGTLVYNVLVLVCEIQKSAQWQIYRCINVLFYA